jgi:Na+/alanine symporter
MGSTPHAHAVANVKKPHDQGTVAIIGVFLDTCIVLTMTALIVISTIYTGNGPLANASGETYHLILAKAGCRAVCSSLLSCDSSLSIV